MKKPSKTFGAAGLVVVAAAAILLGDTISSAMNDASTCISTNGTNCP